MSSLVELPAAGSRERSHRTSLTEKDDRQKWVGSPHGPFESNQLRALEHENLLVAEATAKEIGWISLAEALELTILIAKKEPRRLPKIAVRWLERYLAECEPTLSDVALAVSALAALPHEPRAEAVRVLRALIGSF